jgi:hypothetical protein
MVIKKKRNRVFPFLFHSVVSAAIAGATIAVVNVLIEVVRGESIFSFEDIFALSLWHMVLWAIIGLAVGLVWSLITSLFSQPKQSRFKIIFNLSHIPHIKHKKHLTSSL